MRPTKDWEEDIDQSDNMAALALMQTDDDKDKEDEDAAAPGDEAIGEQGVLTDSALAAPVATIVTPVDEDEEIDELATLDRMEKELKADELADIDIGQEEDL